MYLHGKREMEWHRMQYQLTMREQWQRSEIKSGLMGTAVALGLVVLYVRIALAIFG